MSYEAQGVIKKIMATNQVSDKFKKREFILTVIENNFEETLKFELKQDKVDMLNNSKVGDKVKVQFNLTGREWLSPKTNQTMYFTTLDVWKIDNIEQGQPQPQAADLSQGSDSGNLPF